MRILFLSRWFPYPPNNGSKIRIFNILRQLGQRHDVALLAFAEASDQVDADTLDALRGYCSEVEVVSYRRFRASTARALLGLFSRMPRSLVDTRSEAMAAAVHSRVGKGRCDLIIASQLDMAPYALEEREAPAILEELELTGFRDAARRRGSIGARTRAALTWFKLGAFLRHALPRFAACTVASELEAETLAALVPDYSRVRIVPNAVDLSDYEGDFGVPRSNTMVFAGSVTYSANLDAVKYFLTDVYPLIDRAMPGMRLRVLGRSSGVDLGSLPTYPGVEFTGHVKDVRPEVARSWLSVVPLRVGGGTRLKVLESMALGTPVVSTSKGAEGLAVTDGENVWIANTPRLFADRVMALMQSPGLRNHLSERGKDLVRSRYDWSLVGAALRDVISQVVSDRCSPVRLQTPRGRL